MPRRALAWLSLVPLLLLAPYVGAQGMDEVRIQSVPVADGIYMLLGRGGNIGVSVGSDGAFLIDDQFAPLTPKIQAAVSQLSTEPIRFVFNTHWHGDHTGGNESLGGSGALIVAHENVRTRMATDQVQQLRDRTVPASPAGALPVVTFSDSVTFHWNGTEIHAFHVDPAHTDGDSLIHFREKNVLHMGDTFFNGFYPFIDVDSGGSSDGMIGAVDRALELADDGTQIIPGHGPLAKRADLIAYRDMLRQVRDAVKQQIDQGKDIDAVVAARPTAAFDEKWGGGFMNPETFTRILYADLSR